MNCNVGSTHDRSMDGDSTASFENTAKNSRMTTTTTTTLTIGGKSLLELLPREILTQSIVGSYLDGTALANLWCATMSKRELMVRRKSPRKERKHSPLSMVEEILRIVQRRKERLTEDDPDENDDTNSSRYCARKNVFRLFEEAATIPNRDEHEVGHHNDPERQEGFCLTAFLQLSRNIFGSLSALDYCETVPHNLVWCGVLKIRDFETREMIAARVMMVVHPLRWSGKEIRLWRNATTGSSSFGSPSAILNDTANHCLSEQGQPTIKTEVIPHNFLPVGPNRGRLVGVTECDRWCLREISDRLNRNGMVARFSRMIASSSTTTSPMTITDTNNDSRNRGGQFTVKLLAFDQAQERLDAIFRQRSREPGGIPLCEEKEKMVLDPCSAKKFQIGTDDDINNDGHSLLCCWNHEFLWEDSRSFRMETSQALRGAMKEYRKLTL